MCVGGGGGGGSLPRGAHRSPLWSSLGRGVSFTELIRESCNVFYSCMCSNNPRALNSGITILYHLYQCRYLDLASS